MKKKSQQESIRRVLLLTFAKGLVYGLGMITAFAIVSPLIVWLLSKANSVM